MIGDYKFAARQSLSGNWVRLALILLVIGICSSVITNIIKHLTNSLFLSSAAGLILGCIITIISFGYLKSILLLSKTGSFDYSDIFSGVKQAWDIIVYNIVISLATFLGNILFIIPGIYISLRYSLTLYIMADNPGIRWMDAAKLSANLMQGRYIELLLMQLSFIGWALLSVLTLGVGFFFLIPYIQASLSHFYINAVNSESQF